MIIKKILRASSFILATFQSFTAISLTEEFKRVGYVEFFDELIDFLQTNLVWVQKLYSAKERFICSQDKDYYSTSFFGLYDESKYGENGQISFYYSVHFHDFICAYYSEINQKNNQVI
ncbi:hypothetical protein KBC04_04625 [Candidatus Babeliales bacterium]|nr:hypothetical protein [Candidatus Babeliales bacterium]MBP9844106.1 hypothetical protein [Candidatus Babeliales bacterium]